jgi:hypothetical protein
VDPEVENTRLILRDKTFPTDFNFDYIFHAITPSTSTALENGKQDVFKRCETIVIENCKF